MPQLANELYITKLGAKKQIKDVKSLDIKKYNILTETFFSNKNNKKQNKLVLFQK